MAAAVALTLAAACARTGFREASDAGSGARPEVSVDVVGVRFEQEPLAIGARNVRCWVELRNNGATELFVARASMRTEPADLLTLSAVVDQYPALPAGGAAELPFLGRVSVSAEPQTIALWPVVELVDPVADAAGTASLDAGPWSVALEQGPTLVVNTTANELDGPDDMSDLAQAGETLSLREAITLVNNGHAVRRIVFDPLVFDPELLGTILVGTGPSGKVELPAITADQVLIDATGAGVVVDNAGADFTEAPLLDVQASAVELRGLRLAAYKVALRLLSATSARLVDTIIDGTDADVRIQASDRVTVEGLQARCTRRCSVLCQGSSALELREATVVNGEMRAELCPGLRLQALTLSAGDVRLDGSPDSVFVDVELIRAPAGLTISVSDRVAVRHLIATGLGSSYTNDPLIDVTMSQGVSYADLRVSDWYGAFVTMDAESRLGVSVPEISGATGATLHGVASAADGAGVEIFELGASSIRTRASGTVQHGAWSVQLDVNPTPEQTLVAATTVPGDGSSALGPRFRLPRPSLCGVHPSLFRSSFEASEASRWSLIGSVGFIENNCHDGVSCAWTLQPNASVELVLGLSVDLAGASQPVLRIMRRICDTPGFLGVHLRPSPQDPWTSLTGGDIVGLHGSCPWREEQRALPFAALSATTELRLTLSTSGGTATTGLDQLEICDDGG